MSKRPTAPPRRRLPPRIADLLRPDAYPHPAIQVELRETHISWVLLAGAFAYKVKKPVNFGFLDFSTYERRLAACAEEVRLNRRLCPDVYLGLRQIVRERGRYRIVPVPEDGTSPSGEPVVWMRRLPAGGMLPAMLERHAASPRLVERIATTLARFHERAPAGPEVAAFGSIETVRANWVENFGQTTDLPPHVLPPEQRDTIVHYVECFLEQEASLFRQRVAAGRVRDGHGDLHAASVCLEGRRLHLFDCIEFAARYRCADVAAEVAFLAMDLEHFGRADLASSFVGAYVRQSQDSTLLRLLHFYISYRAYVRGKVAAFRLAERHLDAERATLASRARAYFDLAWAHAGGLGRPQLVVMMGLPASGKSTLARAVASRLGFVHLSTDVLRKTLAGRALEAHTARPFERGLYRPRMTERTYAALRRQGGAWVRDGRSVVLDGTFAQVRQRRMLVYLAHHLGVPLLPILCHADDAILVARLTARDRVPHVVSDARLALWPQLRQAFVEPVELPGLVTIDTTQAAADSVEQVVALIAAAAHDVGHPMLVKQLAAG